MGNVDSGAKSKIEILTPNPQLSHIEHTTAKIECGKVSVASRIASFRFRCGKHSLEEVTFMNGFGQKPQIKPAEIARLNRICQAVLDEEPGAEDRLHAWMIRAIVVLGGREAYDNWFVYDANENLGYEVAGLFHDAIFKMMPEEIRDEFHSKAQDIIVRDFVDAGLTPGKDFSMNSDGGYLLSDRATQHLQEMLPTEMWEGFERDEMIKTTKADPWEAVEERLGVPFRDNLYQRLLDLVEEGRSSVVLAGWLTQLIPAVASQVVGDAEDLHLLSVLLSALRNKHSKMAESIWEALRTGDITEPEALMDMDIFPMVDVLRSAGGNEQNKEISADGDGISRAGLERLSLVWRGSDLSIPELIAAFDQAMKRR